ncbi:MAG: hypothetical protein ACREMK_14390, partial [Gemmatimonadota bacterium]
ANPVGQIDRLPGSFGEDEVRGEVARLYGHGTSGGGFDDAGRVSRRYAALGGRATTVTIPLCDQ